MKSAKKTTKKRSAAQLAPPKRRQGEIFKTAVQLTPKALAYYQSRVAALNESEARAPGTYDRGWTLHAVLSFYLEEVASTAQAAPLPNKPEAAPSV
jgi:hypothetical protein